MVAALAAGLLVLAPTSASADTYLVTSCHDPLGNPNDAVGWVASSTSGGATANTCRSANGGLMAALPDANPSGNATANWRLDAPAGTRIVRVAARRATLGLAGGTTEQKDIAYVMATSGQTLEECSPAVTGSSCVAELTQPIDKQGIDGTYAEFRVLCTNAGRTCSRPLAVAATHMWVGLEDASPPVVANPKVLDDGDASGRLRISYDAADVGGGVYRTIVKVDGKPAATVPIAPAPCADIDPQGGDAFQFIVPIPCPLAVTGAEATVDVRSLPAGPHGIEIAVQDAAGNERSVFGPIEFPRLNAVTTTGSSVSAEDAVNGRLRMWFVKARNRGRRYTSRYGTRVVTRGVLRARGGRGIQGARIDVYHLRNGKRRLLKTGLKSRAGGKLTLILPLNVDTRTIEFAYRALRPGPITSRQRLSLRVIRKGRVFHRR
ncbi:MAG TPA: hypothetical protein VMY78_06510 [Solirubrobacteraceae bacterium]|nr:hypothetical protein [Solirubrobacteraceae bacterium]